MKSYEDVLAIMKRQLRCFAKTGDETFFKSASVLREVLEMDWADFDKIADEIIDKED